MAKKKKRRVPKERLTPNQAEYIHQIKRIEKAVLNLSKTEDIYLSPDFLPERPQRITKKALQKLKSIKPKTIAQLNQQAFEQGLETGFHRVQAPTREELKQEFAPRKHIVHRTRPKTTIPKPATKYPEEWAEYNGTVYRRSTEDGNWYNAETGQYTFPAETTVDEIQYEPEPTPPAPPAPLPKPPHDIDKSEIPFTDYDEDYEEEQPTHPIYDEDNEVWIDEYTGELLDPLTLEPYSGGYAFEDRTILNNLRNEIANAENDEVANILYRALNEEIEEYGINEVCKRLNESEDYIDGLVVVALYDSNGEEVVSKAVELLEIIRGGTMSSTDQTAISSAIYSDNKSRQANYALGYELNKR